MNIPSDEKIKKLLTSASDTEINKGLELVKEKFEKHILGYFSQKSNNRLTQHEKDDLFQFVQIALWENIKNGNYNENGNLKSYLLKIAANQLKNYFRKLKNRKERTLDPDQFAVFFVDPKDEEADRDIQEIRDLALEKGIRILDECVELLDEENQDIFLLYYEDCWSVKEIAVALNQKESWVKGRLFTIRGRLKKCREDKESYETQKKS